MLDNNDWRITNQKDYLQGKELIYSKYHAKSDKWEHEHCEFCWEKFIEGSVGYCTIDERYWICEGCYCDFRVLFQWKIQP